MIHSEIRENDRELTYSYKQNQADVKDYEKTIKLQIEHYKKLLIVQPFRTDLGRSVEWKQPQYWFGQPKYSIIYVHFCAKTSEQRPVAVLVSIEDSLSVLKLKIAL